MSSAYGPQLVECKCSPPGEHRPSMMAPRGALFAENGHAIFPWEEPHPDDIRERDRQRVERRAKWQGVKRQAVHGVTPRALKALHDECDALARTPEGSRNSQANTSAFNLAQLVAMGELPEYLAMAELWAATMETGLPEAEARRTLRSGFDAGMEKPR